MFELAKAADLAARIFFKKSENKPETNQRAYWAQKKKKTTTQLSMFTSWLDDT